jgi:hypothetical protein
MMTPTGYQPQSQFQQQYPPQFPPQYQAGPQGNPFPPQQLGGYGGGDINALQHYRQNEGGGIEDHSNGNFNPGGGGGGIFSLKNIVIGALGALGIYALYNYLTGKKTEGTEGGEETPPEQKPEWTQAVETLEAQNLADVKPGIEKTKAQEINKTINAQVKKIRESLAKHQLTEQQNQAKTRLEQAYAVLAQQLTQVENEEGDIPGDNAAVTTEIQEALTAFKKEFKDFNPQPEQEHEHQHDEHNEQHH